MADQFKNLADETIFSFEGGLSGLEGYENKFIKRGSYAIPYLGSTAPTTFVSGTNRESGAAIASQSAAEGGTLQAVSKNGINAWLDPSSGTLYNDPYGRTTMAQTGATTYITPEGFSQSPSFAEELAAEGMSWDAKPIPITKKSTPIPITKKSTAQGMDISGLNPNQRIQVGKGNDVRTVTVSQAQPFLKSGFSVLSTDAPSAMASVEQSSPVSSTGLPTYTGGNRATPSIVDFLKSVGQDSSFSARQKLAQIAGIQNYSGTAEQNTQLLNALKSQSSTQSPGGALTPESFDTAEKIDFTGIDQIARDATIIDNVANATAKSAGSTIDELMRMLTPQDTELDAEYQGILDKMTGLVGEQANKGQDQLQAEQQAGLPGLREELAKINAEYLQKAAEYDVLSSKNEGEPITMNSIIGNEAQISRMKASELGLLEARALGLSGRIQAAQDAANRAIDLKYSTIEAKLNIYQAQLNALTPQLNKQEQARALAQQVILDDRKQALADAKAEEQSIQGLALEYIKAGGTSADIIGQISNAKSYNQALDIFGKNAPKQEPNIQKLGQDSLGNDVYGYYDTVTGSFKTVNADGGFSSTTSDSIDVPSYITDAITVVTGSNKLTKDQKNSFIQAMQSGQDPFTVLKNQAKDILGATLAGELTKLETARSQMQNLQFLIDEYYKNDGKTDLFKGTMENVQNRLGLVNDPKLVEIATTIQAALQQYRNAISGTAYSEQEGRDIASVFPGINKTEGLNDAIIQGRMNAFDNSIESMYKIAVGDVYNTIKGVSQLQSVDTSNLPVISQSFPSVQDLLAQHPQYEDLAIAIGNVYPDATLQQTLELISAYSPSFNEPLSMGVNSSKVAGIKNYSKVVTSIGSGVATGIQQGSPLWKWGYDLVLSGGKGAPVKTPVSGTVVMAKKDGGFGNRVGVKDLAGNIWFFGHLDRIEAKEGQRVNALASIGTQGNTGKTLGKTGIHVDITVKKPDGSYYTSQEVAAMLNTRKV